MVVSPCVFSRTRPVPPAPVCCVWSPREMTAGPRLKPRPRVVRRRAVFIEMKPLGEHFEAGNLLRVVGKVRTKVGPSHQGPGGPLRQASATSKPS